MERVGLEWPNKEDDNYALMQAWKHAKDRFQKAHTVALKMMHKFRSDPFVYHRTLSHLLNNITHPAEYAV